MHMNKSFGRVFLLYGTLFFVWQTTYWLSLSNHPTLNGSQTMDMVAFCAYYFFGGCGALGAGLLCDKKPLSHARLGRLLRFCALGAALLTPALRLVRPFPLLLAGIALNSLCGFSLIGFLMFAVFRHIPYRQRPLFMGVSLGLNVLLRLPVEYAASFGGDVDMSIPYMACGSAALLLFFAAGTLWGFSFGDTPPAPPGDAAQNPPAARGVLVLGVLCSVMFYFLFGIYDHAMGRSGAGSIPGYMFLIRVVQVVCPVLAGLLCWRFGRYATVLVSIVLQGLGSLALLFGFSGPFGLVFSLFSAASHTFFSVPTRVLFADLSHSAKRAGFVASLGFTSYYFWQLLGVPVSLLIGRAGTEFDMLLFMVLFLVAVVCFILFYGKIQALSLRAESGALPAPPPSAGPAPPAGGPNLSAFGLTPREKELIPYLLGPLTSEEIAAQLHISPNTLKTHVRNILGKTGTASRRQLQKQMMGETVACEANPPPE